MKYARHKAGVFLILIALLLGGCAANAVPSPYDLKLKTKVEKLTASVGGETIQAEIKIDSRRYQELSSEQNIYLSYHILSPEGEVILHDGIRTPLETIEARGVKKETVEIAAPFDAGEYVVEIDLVEENITWFSEKGMETVRIPLTVAETYSTEYEKVKNTARPH